jgi:hypothetical protein
MLGAYHRAPRTAPSRRSREAPVARRGRLIGRMKGGLNTKAPCKCRGGRTEGGVVAELHDDVDTEGRPIPFRLRAGKVRIRQPPRSL